MSELISITEAAARGIEIHLLHTCLSRKGEHHVVATLGAFKALPDDAQCKLCATVLRQLEEANSAAA